MTPHPKQSLHRAVSSLHSKTAEQMSDSNRRRPGSRKRTIAFGVLLAIAVTSVVLQVLASEHRWTPAVEKEGSDIGKKYSQDGGGDSGDGEIEAGGGEGSNGDTAAGSGNDHHQLLEHPAADIADLGVGDGDSDRESATTNLISELRVDRRFRGQRTGKPPRTKEEKYVARSSAGPFGWGTDWSIGVAVPVVVGEAEEDGEEGEEGRELEEDVIKPPWCATPQNRSFVDFVYAKRGRVDPHNRVRTQRWGCVHVCSTG